MKNKILLSSILLSSIILSIYIHSIIKRKKEEQIISGYLRIDNSDSDNKNALFLELLVPVSDIKNKNIINLKIVNEDYIRR